MSKSFLTTVKLLDVEVSGDFSFKTVGKFKGDFSNSTLSLRNGFQSSTANGNTNISAIPNGTATTSSFVAFNASDPDNAGRIALVVTSTEAQLRQDKSGSGSYLNINIQIGSTVVAVARTDFDFEIKQNILYQDGSKQKSALQDSVRHIKLETDFLYNNDGIGGNGIASGTNTGTLPTAYYASVYGFKGPRASTSANSGYSHLWNVSQWAIVGGVEEFDFVFWTPATGATISDIQGKAGFLDSNSASASTDQIAFDFGTGMLMTGKVYSNGSTSSTGSSYQLVVNTGYHMKFIVNSTSLVTFYIYDMSGAQLWTDTVATNIPSGTSRIAFGGYVLTATGTTAKDLGYIDYMGFTFKNIQRGKWR